MSFPDPDLDDLYHEMGILEIDSAPESAPPRDDAERTVRR
jgi:hypothetical protein